MIRVGTSGYNYREWRGRFYPEKLRPTEMLPFYAARFPTVENSKKPVPDEGKPRVVSPRQVIDVGRESEFKWRCARQQVSSKLGLFTDR